MRAPVPRSARGPRILRHALTLLCVFVSSFLFEEHRAAAPWEGPPFSSEPQALLAMAAARTVAPEAPALAMLDDTYLVLDGAQRATRTRRLIYQVVSQAGVLALSTVEVPWRPWQQERPAVRARVITKDGSIHWLDAGTLAESPVPAISPDIYSDTRVLRAPLPAVAPGSIVEQEIVVRDTAPFFDGGFVEQFNFGWVQVPLDLARISIDAPADVPLRWIARVDPALEPVRSTDPARIRLLFERRDVAPVDRPELFLPSDLPPRPYVAVSTSPSWSDVASRYAAIVEHQIVSGPVAPQSAEAAAGVSGRDAIARSVLAYVTSHLRYTGVEFGAASIVPGPPAETLKRHYGDCKDQAALMVAMLRDAGVAAHVALLRAGFGPDTDETMPGLDEFNHAIVYVPGDAPIWIDPTNKYGRVGELPSADRGRKALVAARETTGLVSIPDSGPAENLITVTREILLAENGPAHVVETTEFTGGPESQGRYSYASHTAKDTREWMEKYVRENHQSETIRSFENSDIADLTSHFQVKVDIDGARYAQTDASGAFVGILSSEMSRGLREMLEADWKDDLSATGRPSLTRRAGGQPRRSPLQVPEPLALEWRYHIVPPPGFEAQGLPEARSTPHGPTMFSSRFERLDDGSVSATLRFECPKIRLAPEKVDELRQELGREKDGPPIMLVFRSIGQAHLSSGQLREALDEFRRIAALHPGEARHRTDIACALMTAGLGETAMKEARAAVALDPQSKEAQRGLGWVLQHDAIGRQFGKGWDRDGAIAAYRKAKELDPNDLTTRMDLADLLQRGEDGSFNSPSSSIDGALAEYEEARRLDDSDVLEDAILSSSFRAERFDEAVRMSRALSPTTERLAHGLAASAATNGAAAAMHSMLSFTSGSGQRRDVLRMASVLLLQVRRYEASADLMAEATKGTLDASQWSPFIELLRRTRRFEERGAAGNDPKSFVARLVTLLADPRRDAAVARGMFVAGMPESVVSSRFSALANNPMLAAFGEIDLPWQVGVDLLISSLDLEVDGSDAIGYRVRVRPFASLMMPTGFSFYLIREGDHLLLASMTGLPGELGRQAMRRFRAGDLDGARQWLRWASADLRGADGSFSGVPFSGLWKEGSASDRNQVLYAAASLEAETSEAADALRILKDARSLTLPEDRKLYMDMARARAYESLKQYADLLELARWLTKSQPGMGLAYSYLAAAHAGLKQWAQLRQAAQERLQSRPGDDEALRSLAMAHTRLGSYKEAETVLKKLAAKSPPFPPDLNNLAWLGLHHHPASAEFVKFGEQAATMTQHGVGAFEHTLAALYADTGRLDEAHKLLVRSLELDGRTDPEGDTWFVLGLIAEGMGEPATALADYDRVARTEDDDGLSVFQLSRARIRALAPPAPAKP